MSKLGYQMFARSPEWLANHCARRFGYAVLAILRKDPEQSDLAVANAMMAWFEPDLLDIKDPVLTTMAWDTEPVRWSDGRMGDMYLHEAQVPFRGTPDLWRLVGSERYRFTAHVSCTTKTARLRAFRPDRDVDQFRASILTDLGNARLHATQQGPAVDAFRLHLHTAVEHCYGHQDLGGLRDHARELREKDDRLDQALAKAGRG